MPRRYRPPTYTPHERAQIANRARHSPSTYIRALGRAKLTDADVAALAALLASALAGQQAPGTGGETA
jgi:hypothetical protein